jgi:hypothetical protein
MQPDHRDTEQAADHASSSAVTDFDVRHLLEEANRTWDVLQHDLPEWPHHPAA